MKRIFMCPPKHYKIGNVINPWMKNSYKINNKKAFQQWENLKFQIENFLNIKVNTINAPKELPDMVFSRDTAVIVNKTAILANFKYKQRQPEAQLYKKWLKKQGIKVISLPKNFLFEGGDFLIWKNKILAGHGFRTKKNTHKLISRILNLPVVSLKLTNPFFYHLDTALFPLQNMFIFYPQAFDKKSRMKLKNLGPTISISKKAAFSLCLNSLFYQDKIITNNPEIFDFINSPNHRILKVDVSEFQKSGGGIHCLTGQIN